MTVWVATAAGFVLGVLLANAVGVRRYSRVHLEGHVALHGRGVFFSRTPDGFWWRLRLRARRRSCSAFPGPDDGGPDIGVREPHRPSGPQLSGSVQLRAPGA